MKKITVITAVILVILTGIIQSGFNFGMPSAVRSKVKELKEKKEELKPAGPGLPVTGQTTVYRTGDDGYYQAGLAFDYTDNGDGTVTDNNTGLMWAKDGSGAGCNNGNTLTWNDAIDWAENLDFAGYTDWRLPNMKELNSLVVYEGSAPYINTTYFPNIGSWYWTSTTCPSDTGRAMNMDFNDGIVGTVVVTGDYYVRAVRGGPAQAGGLPVTGQTTVYRTGDDGTYRAGLAFDYTDNGDGTVTDNNTELMWAKDGNGAGANNGNTLTWNDAIDWAENLDFAGYTDWRLPNMKELHSLVVYEGSAPYIDTTYFPNTVDGFSGFYWTSTTSASEPADAMEVTFSNGGVYGIGKVSTIRVRAVRGGP